MKNLMIRLWKEEEGQDLTEYALLLVLIALSAVAIMGTLGKAINNVFQRRRLDPHQRHVIVATGFVWAVFNSAW